MRRFVPKIEAMHHAQGLADPFPHGFFIHSEVEGTECDIVKYSRHEKLVIGVLKNDPDLFPDLPPRFPGKGKITDGHRSRRRHQAAVHVLEQRRFSRPVGPDDADRFAVGDPEIDPSERFRPVRVAEGHVFEVNDVMTHANNPWTTRPIPSVMRKKRKTPRNEIVAAMNARSAAAMRDRLRLGMSP